MKATDILIDEHDVILGVIDSIEKAATSLEDGQTIRAGFFLDAADFIKGFADGCHHRKEEGVLFKAMIEAGMPAQGGPIPVMLAEHEQGRAFTRAMRQAAQKMEAGDPAALEAVLQNARGYAALLRQHIMKENQVLFPMANRVIPPEKQNAVEEAFQHVEHEETGQGVHEKYLALAEALQREVGN